MDLSFNIAMLSWALLTVICGFAVIRGGRPERWGAFINVAASLATLIARLLFASAWLPAALSVLIIDVAVAIGFFWLATTSTRFWPIWAFGFALSNLLMSVGAAFMPDIVLFVYHTGLGIYAYLALGALALGTYRLPRDADPVLRNGARSQWLEIDTKAN